VKTDESRGKLDSVKIILPWSGIYSYTQLFRNNPIALLQLMAHDTTELNYVGIVKKNGVDYHIVQLKLGQKWVDVHIEEGTFRVVAFFENRVDNDAPFGRRQLIYKVSVSYSDYINVDGFLLPCKIEETNHSMFYTQRNKLNWISINKPLPDSIFNPVPSGEHLERFRKIGLGNGLFVFEKSNNWQHERSLVRIAQREKSVVFTTLSNNLKYNKLFLDALYKEFGENRVSRIYQMENLYGFLSLRDFFAANFSIYAPKGRGFLSEHGKNWNAAEDSVFTVARASGLLNTFDKDFQIEDLHVLVLNSNAKNESEEYIVSYYLPDEKIIYFQGNPYSANKKDKNAHPREKLLYDLIKQRNLSVEKIVYSGAYIDNAPLFMSFNDFEKRILNTDFTIYKN
jgi:hypothetical protein